MRNSYYVQIGEREYAVVLDTDTNKLDVELGGRAYAIDLIMQEQGGIRYFSVLLRGRSYDVFIEPADGERGYRLTLEGEPYIAHVLSERARNLAGLAKKSATTTAQTSIAAPMPGLVRTISVAVGDIVELGQRLLGLEAMKMENDIRAPHEGQIKAISVTVGQTVNRGQVLLVLGPAD